MTDYLLNYTLINIGETCKINSDCSTDCCISGACTNPSQCVPIGFILAMVFAGIFLVAIISCVICAVWIKYRRDREEREALIERNIEIAQASSNQVYTRTSPPIYPIQPKVIGYQTRAIAQPTLYNPPISYQPIVSQPRFIAR